MHSTRMLCAAVLIAAATTADARDDHLMMPLADAFEAPDARAKLDPRIKLYFGDQRRPATAKSLGTFKTNKKTSAFGKTEKQACEWAFLSAMLQLQERARREGGNAVVNIESIYKNQVVSSEKQYMCGAGAMVAGVAFRGEVVKLAK